MRPEGVSVDVRPTVGVKITQNNKIDYTFEIIAREALNGDLLIYDHKDIDIVLMQEKKKIIEFLNKQDDESKNDKNKKNI